MLEGEREERDFGELKELVESLRESILELKATISDISGPFSKAKERAESMEAEEAESTLVTPLSASHEIAHQVQQISKTSGKRESNIREGDGGESTLEASSIEKPFERTIIYKEEERIKHKEPTQRWSLNRVFKMLRLLNTLSKTLPEENIKSYIKLLKLLGFIDDSTQHTLEALMEIIETGRRANSPPENQMIVIYTLARVLGLRDPGLDEETALILVERMINGQKSG